MLDNLHDSSPQLSPPGRSNKSQHASAQANFSMHRLTSSDQDHLVQQEYAILQHLRWILRFTLLKPLYSPMFSAHIRIQYRPFSLSAGKHGVAQNLAHVPPKGRKARWLTMGSVAPVDTTSHFECREQKYLG